MKAILTVLGRDKTGIIYGISKILSDNQVNIEDISQTILQEYFTMMMLVDLSNLSIEFDDLKKQLEILGNQMILSVKIQREEIFNTMHTI
ncbi:MAG: ACT domain-containing protein [Eubacteriales bacterium]